MASPTHQQFIHTNMEALYVHGKSTLLRKKIAFKNKKIKIVVSLFNIIRNPSIKNVCECLFTCFVWKHICKRYIYRFINTHMELYSLPDSPPCNPTNHIGKWIIHYWYFLLLLLLLLLMLCLNIHILMFILLSFEDFKKIYIECIHHIDI